MIYNINLSQIKEKNYSYKDINSTKDFYPKKSELITSSSSYLNKFKNENEKYKNRPFSYGK